MPDTVCLVRLSAIGDTCHALAVVRNLKDNWPDTKLTWIIGRTEASLLGDIAGVEFIIFDKRQGLGAYRQVIDTVGRRRFDMLLCMHASMRVNWLYATLPADRKIGFDHARAKDFQWLVSNERIPAVDGEHALDAMMGFAHYAGTQRLPVRWDIPLPEAARAYARRHADSDTVVVSPVSTQRFRNYRNWPLERFEAVVDYLTRHCKLKVVVTGGGTALEHEYAASLARMPAVSNLVGKSSLKELVAVFERARLVICPDSGPAHMATAVGTPVLGLYATSNPERTGPYRHREWTVNRYPDAAERFLGKRVDELAWGERVRHPDAMNLITVDDVVAKIEAFRQA